MLRNKAVKEPNSLGRRIVVLKYVLFVAFGLILIKLFFMQILEHEFWLAKAEKRHTFSDTIIARRGEIYMMDQNEPVAVVLNQTVSQITIDPGITEKDEIKKALEENAKEYITADLESVYQHEGLRYYVVAKNVPRDIANKIIDLGIPGVQSEDINKRVYPEGELASSLLGFINDTGEGQYGVERSLNQILKGENGQLKTTSDINNVALSIGSNNIKIPAKDGQNIVLSIDRGLEKGVEDIAIAAIENTTATNIAALIMDPNNGEVIAMANLPNYDPSNYGYVVDETAYTNYVTEIPYEPASVCKNFAFSAAINEGLMTGNTTYFNQGYEMVDGWKIQNAEQRSMLYGTIDMKTALYWSLNTGSIYALKLLGGNSDTITSTGREKLYDYYYNKFRLGRTTGIELLEAEGYIPDPNEGWGRNSVYANMTFGQNLGITMIQTATAFSAIVNGGFYRTPTIVKGVLEKEEITKLPKDEFIEKQILSADTSTAMRDMLVNNRSHKVRAGIDRPGYSIGGKSGTAQVIRDGAYDDSMSETVGTYIGFVATEGELPKYIIMVKMWGEGQYLDGGMAGEVFDDLSNYLIDYLKIKPKA